MTRTRLGREGGCARARTAWRATMEGMRVSTRTDYATRALLSLALHGSSRPTSVKEIAERTSLPQPYLEQILLAVKGAGIVTSKRGVGGGYVLAHRPSEITLEQIFAAVEGPQPAPAEPHDHCEGHCVVQEIWIGLATQTRVFLSEFTLADLAERTRVGHPNAVPAPSDSLEPVEHGAY